ncbi:DNA-directed DNA polymerase alpha subunit pol12 [Leucoagaricus gongylophorus]
MHPARRNKVDISKLTPDEQNIFQKYGKLPTNKNLLLKMQKDRKYFDSGDYALSKAGVTPQSTVGTAIPNPENIPHASPGVSIGHQIPSISPTSTSPVNRESGLSQMNIEFSEAEAEEGDQEDVKDKMTEPKPSTSEAAAGTTTRRIQEVRMETQEINDINTTV